ncbi:3-isopropylmalate dehydratase small subunit [Methylobacterium oxalidis]|uniref:3-isopropylmalate dehydratase small subunit n=1 Tax=Methylobacterium oxalidis TaxID=944322 RepID=A0A512J792_9HYPH|nr:3-isopropylmalate dehydratase small subunit [Methylobacterium oxalidis]GEP05813.1 3-isopropylmalate dehydratase small subunit [Methylobacterium oxalidis]GJE34399.1 3-isopropylmalate dehydratase small subunit 1 [Methylobacterium oxalidis]GLS66482.1 3-isopropylmalate dehydratase small subunit [Methylobacterium oxalidis]
MHSFTTVTGAAAPLPAANVDTDVIMPKQFLKGIDRAGLDRGAFHDLRFAPDGSPRPDFVLNRPGWEETRFLVVGPNFGCGSSREHAVWGLLQLGIRAIIGTTFAGIFADNAANNGLLLVSLDPGAVSALLARAADPEGNRLTVDLPGETILAEDGTRHAFEIPPSRKDALVRGLDAIGQTLDRAAEIRAFEARHHAARPWLAR